MLENQLSRYGAISRVTPDLAPGAKLFLVSDSDDTTVGPANLGAEYPVDKDGVVRVYTTIQAAANAASANRGDVVGVLPGYDHTLSRADSWATAGVKVVGLGASGDMPIVRFASTTDNVKVKANNVTVKNIKFLADADSVTLGLDLDTGYSGNEVKGCIFDFDSTGQNFKKMLRVGSKRTIIEGNQFLSEDTVGTGFGIDIYGGMPDYLTIKGNYFVGQFDTNGDTTNHSSPIGVDSGHDSTDTTLSGLRVEGNTIISSDTAAAVLLNFAAAGVTGRGCAAIDNKLVSFDTAATDSDQVAWGTVLPLNNTLRVGDSDTAESIIGFTAKHGVADS